VDLLASSLTPSSGTCYSTWVFHLLTSLRRQGIDLENSTRNLLAGACPDSALAGLPMHEAIPQTHYLVVDRWVACPRDMLP
jgi:hypothetical protein